MFLKIILYFLCFKVDNFVFSTCNIYIFSLLLYACTLYLLQLVPTYLPTYYNLPNYLPSYLHTYYNLPTYLLQPTYLPTFIFTYLLQPTNLLTYLCIYLTTSSTWVVGGLVKIRGEVGWLDFDKVGLFYPWLKLIKPIG